MYLAKIYGEIVSQVSTIKLMATHQVQRFALVFHWTFNSAVEVR